MAYTNSDIDPRSGALHRLTGKVIETLTWLVNIRPMIDEAERLTRMTDADLAAKGTSRPAEITRIFGPRAHY